MLSAAHFEGAALVRIGKARIWTTQKEGTTAAPVTARPAATCLTPPSTTLLICCFYHRITIETRLNGQMTILTIYISITSPTILGEQCSPALLNSTQGIMAYHTSFEVASSGDGFVAGF